MNNSLKTKTTEWYGFYYALSILIAWVICLIYALFFFQPTLQNIIISSLLFAALTFLYTGLFIQAHDAMHGSLVPHQEKLNDFMGSLCVILYAAFDYKKLKNEHFKHHVHVASHADPDYASTDSFAFWYFRFMQHYLSFQQIFIMFCTAQVLQHLCKVPLLNLLCFWALPALLSTLQLFYFGTYLPHRRHPTGYENEHCCISLEYPELWSLLACYHFGYHYEHHSSPLTPWWKLPELKTARRKLTHKNARLKIKT